MKTQADFPKISIVTPNYNYGSFLEETILSVINQGYPNLEYIIIDGGSTDNSVDIIRKYEKHLFYWISEPDKGVYDAINKGFEKCTGDVMAYLNSDDIYLPWCLQTVAEIFISFPEVRWLSTLQPGYIDHQSRSRWFRTFPGFSKECFLDGHYAGRYSMYTYIQQESTFWRKELWEITGSEINLSHKLAGDFYTWNKFYKYAELFGVFNPLSLFRINTQQKSADIEQYIHECLAILETNEKALPWKSVIASGPFNLKNYQVPFTKFLFKKPKRYSGGIIKIANINTDKSKWEIVQTDFSF